MYHVIGTAAVATILYLLSWIFYRSGYYSLKFHRQLWNIILATVFILTALAGVFLALQINYKWNIPYIETILKWHAEIGSGMAITGLFHFIWHFSYYTGLLRKTKDAPGPGTAEIPGDQQTTIEGRAGERIQKPASLRMNLFNVGFVSSSFQLLLLREIMNITGGYELISGTFLGSWLIASAAGSLLGGRSGLTDLRKINLTFALSPLISIFLLLLLSGLFLKTGQTPSFPAGFVYTLIVLLPVCISSGFTFIKLIDYGKINGFIPGSSFSIETAGGVAAGIFISIITAGIINTWQIILLIFSLNLQWVLLKYYWGNSHIKLAIKVICLLVAVVVLIFNVDIIFRRILLPAISVTGTHDTPYGNITTGESSGEPSTFYNHRLLTYAGDAAEREENIHYAMLQCDKPEKVILISGSLPSHLPELLKYHIMKVLYVERDPGLVIVPENIPAKVSVEVAEMDGFRFIRKENESVDAILLLVPPPSTLLLNRYYTTGFFREAKKKLNQGGVFMCSPGTADLYYNHQTIVMFSSVYNSLKSVFKNVLPVAGNKLYFLASDKQLTTSICELSRVKNIENIYVGPNFLADDLIKARSHETIAVLDPEARENTSSFPTAYMGFLSNIFEKHTGTKTPSVILLMVVFALPVFAIRRRNILMYTAAATLAGFEIIILLVLQLTAGNMYHLTGVILAAFMTGLAAGAGSAISAVEKMPFWSKSVILLTFYLIAGLLFEVLVNIEDVILSVTLLFILTLIPAFLTGNIFRELSGNIKGRGTVSGIYSSDLAGSAMGFLLITGIAIPLMGIKSSLFLLSAVVFAGLALATILRNR